VCKVNADPKKDKLVSSTTQHNPSDDEPLREDGKELFINVPTPGAPGGQVKFISASLTPAYMKKVPEMMEGEHDIQP
jgi:hypothetical protein